MFMNITAISMIGGLIYLVASIGCLVNIINPRWMWKKFESHNAVREPSPQFFMGRRLTAAVLFLILNFMMVMPTVMFLLER